MNIHPLPHRSPKQSYPRAVPSMPSLRADARRELVVRRSTTVADLSASADSSLAYLAPSPPLNARSFNETTDQLSRDGSRRKTRRYGYDFNQDLSLDYQPSTGDATDDRRRNSFLPSIHTQEESHLNSITIRTPSSTYSSSLYTPEFDFEFPQPPAISPDLNAHKDSPLFTVEETCQVKDFLRRRQGTIDSIQKIVPLTATFVTSNNTRRIPSSSALSVVGHDGPGVDSSWTENWKEQELGDFSWEACEGEVDANHSEDTHNLLDKMGLLDDKNGGALNVSVATRPIRVSKIPAPHRKNMDDVSVVLSALRSSIDSEDSGAKAPMRKWTLDDDPDRDRGFQQELRKRLRTKSTPEIARRREASAFYTSSPGTSNSTPPSRPYIRDVALEKRAISSQVSLTQKSALALRPSRSSGGLRDPHILGPPQNPGTKHAVNVQNAVHERSFAFERLESSISKLQTHDPNHSRKQSQVYPPNGQIIHHNSRLNALPSMPSKIPMRGPLEIRKPTMHAFPSRERLSERLHAQPQPSLRSSDLGEGYFHTRSPSAPAAVASPKPKLPAAPPCSLHEMRPVPAARNDSFRSYAARKHDAPQPPPVPPLPPIGKQSKAEGLRSFMDVTPEQKPRHTHTRSRSSMAAAAVHAQKARKMLVRASISVANWGKGLARSGSKKV